MSNFDLNSIDFSDTVQELKNDSFAPIPAGRYVAQLVEWSQQETKDGSGVYIKVRFDITEGDRAGRVLFSNMNVANRSAQAQSIGRREIARLLGSFGGDIESGKIIEQLNHFIGSECELIVGIRKSEQYGDQNVIKGYASLPEKRTPAPAKKPEPAADKPATGRRPWEK